MEYQQERRCGAEGVKIRTIGVFGASRVDLAVSWLRSHGLQNRKKLDRTCTTSVAALREAQADMEVTEVAVCPFEGVVTVHVGMGVERWTCPVCRTEYDKDVES